MRAGGGENNLKSYRALSSSQSFRLLRLQPSSDPAGQLACTLQETALQEPLIPGSGDYEAISYTWGSSHDRVDINCDGELISATRNCDEVLRSLRDAQRSRLLWIDALCINQNDLDERNQQVQIMGFIYRSAARVLIWLGSGTPYSDSALKFLASFEDIVDKRGVERGQLVEKKSAEHMVLCQGGESPLMDLATRELFSRVWTIQEVALATRAVVICGSTQVDWDVFAYAIYRLQKHTAESTGMEGAEGSLWDTIEAHQTVRELFNSRVELSNVRRLLPTKLIHILVGAGGKHATEPRDMVFAFYGVLSALNVTIPAPDYKKPIASVYHEATRAIVERDQSLEVLSRIGGVSRLPDSRSWAFNWLDRYCPMSISSSQFFATGHMYKERSDSLKPPFIFSEDGHQLVLKGRKLDAISIRSHTVITAEDIALISSQSSRIQAAVCAPKLIQMFQEWIHLWGKLPDFPSYLGDEGRAVAAFLRLLTQDGSMVYEGIMKLQLLEKGFVEWYGLVTADMRGRDESSMAELEAMTEDPSSSDPLIPPWLPQQFHSVTETDEWKIMQAISKNRLARLFHEHAKDCSLLKAFFLTENGYMGTAPYSIQQDDQIFLALGLHVPLVLRPNDSPPNTFTLVCSAFVQGLMYGEKWREYGLVDELQDIVIA